jgi:hypothetical protein
MTTRRALRAGQLVCAALAVQLALVCTGVAAGQATIGPISWQDELSFTDAGLVPCYPDLVGTLTGTDTGAGQFVVTSNGVHVEGVETQTYRIDFANGWYLLSSSPTHFDTNFDFANGQTENTLAQQDHGTLFGAGGDVIGALDVSGVTHLTWRDLNGNGQPDPGEITANVNRLRFSCP